MFLMFIPSDDSRIQIDVDLLDLLILLKALNTQVTADSGLLVTAPRSLVKCRVITVDPGNTCADL